MADTPKQTSNGFIDRIGAFQDYDKYRALNWTGTFEEYLGIVKEHPQVARTAYQRLLDMVISKGVDEYIDAKKKLIRYRFFTEAATGHEEDTIFGLDIPLMRFVNVLKAAAEGYGPERRILLLHGPVGSAKSTIGTPSQARFRRVHED